MKLNIPGQYTDHNATPYKEFYIEIKETQCKFQLPMYNEKTKDTRNIITKWEPAHWIHAGYSSAWKTIWAKEREELETIITHENYTQSK